MPGVTPSQTVGPYFKYGLTPGSDYQWTESFGNNLLTPDVVGQRIQIVGHVFDGDGGKVSDSMLEIWQADSQGRFADLQNARSLPNASFRGFGRAGTDSNGMYSFHTIKPGSIAGPKEIQSPHILLAVFARGITRQLQTRIYFDDEVGNINDPILALVPAERRSTLIAIQDHETAGSYRFDVHLQGDLETVFFDL